MNDLLGIFGARCVGCRAFGSPLCAECRRAIPPASEGARPEAVDAVWAAYRYEGLARRLILDLKLRHLRVMAAPLADAMTDRLWSVGCGAEAITWVPARRRDIFDRGFDHAYLLARGVSRRTGLPLRPLLHRTARVRDQTDLGREDRRANLHGAFEAADDPPSSVLLIDDLVTTGATATACAVALRWAGVRRIEALTGCRA